ncbi:Mitochondrial inner membrane protein Mitofilin [Dillenia turbinata]|uniref:Mitochondrial inner membrane protein Mitofilin n=1 Tax=Dillenia turbinata TaxID=194707 RepID=A0AAN8V590_9MAGN
MLRRLDDTLDGRQKPERLLVKELPSFLSCRKEYSASSKQNAHQEFRPKPPESETSGGHSPKVLLGSLAVGTALFVAHQSGYLDKFLGKEDRHSSGPVKVGTDGNDSNSFQLLGEEITKPNNQEPITSSSVMEETEKDASHSHYHHHEDLSTNNNESQFQTNGVSKLPPEENVAPDYEKELSKHTQSSMATDDQGTQSPTPTQESLVPETTNAVKQNEEDVVAPKDSQTNATKEEALAKKIPPEHLAQDNKAKDALDNGTELSTSLLDAYYLNSQAEEGIATSLDQKGTDGQEDTSKGKEASADDLKDAYISNDGKLVLDFLQAIHAAEKRQADIDARKFTEEKRVLKEKYEKDLRDARARELMYAEEAAILDKELKRERSKAAAAIKSLQEKAEEKLKTELEKKVEEEAENELKKAQELAKAELAAAIAREKASQIEKIAEADLHINALCMAFFARSEETRQAHSVHELALGALALEDALSKGLPIEAELDALHTYVGTIDKDSLLHLVLSSFPEETQKYGTDTQLQLNQKFDRLKGPLRHFGMIPPGGGGILTHAVAHIASWLKVKEVDYSGDGIESVINRVDKFLAEGKLAEAADALEEGIRNSTAAEIVSDWVKSARNRAIAEQAVSLLESYATSHLLDLIGL